MKAVIVALDGDRVAKYQLFDEQAAAEAHLERVREAAPGAFIAEAPGSDPADWVLRNGTLVVEPDPARVAAQEEVAARDALQELDAQTIDAVREHLAAQGVPEFVQLRDKATEHKPKIPQR